MPPKYCTVFISKYALTTGVYRLTKAWVVESNPTMVGYNGRHGVVTYYHKPDWHETADAALARAEELRARQIQATERKLNKLRSMQFPIYDAGVCL